MLSTSRSRLPFLLSRTTPFTRRAISSTRSLFAENREQPNPPQTSEKPLPPNVSATNEQPVDSAGAFDASLVEAAEDGEKQRQMQAPNRTDVWSRSQQPRSKAMVGPRFEQTIMELQVGWTVFWGARWLESWLTDSNGDSLNHMLQ